MPRTAFTIQRAPVFLLATLLFAALISVAAAQSQEPKPALPATPGVESGQTPLDGATTGVSGSSWQGPTWGVGVSWDPAVWSVANEGIAPGYDGLQLDTPASTVFIESYAGYGGDAAACLVDAEREIGEREGVSEVVPLTGRPLPTPEEVRGAAQIFGITAQLPDGTPFRGIEFVECRTLEPGVAVLELTWQTVTSAFNEQLPLVESLFAAIDTGESGVSGSAATPVARPQATPVARPQTTPVARPQGTPVSRPQATPVP